MTREPSSSEGFSISLQQRCSRQKGVKVGPARRHGSPSSLRSAATSSARSSRSRPCLVSSLRRRLSAARHFAEQARCRAVRGFPHAGHPTGEPARGARALFAGTLGSAEGKDTGATAPERQAAAGRRASGGGSLRAFRRRDRVLRGERHEGPLFAEGSRDDVAARLSQPAQPARRTSAG